MAGGTGGDDEGNDAADEAEADLLLVRHHAIDTRHNTRKDLRRDLRQEMSQKDRQDDSSLPPRTFVEARSRNLKLPTRSPVNI